MDLITLVLSKRIGGLEENIFEQVLIGSHESLSLKKAGQGMLMLTDNTIVKCVSNYYRGLEDSGKKVKHSNAALQCHYAHETLSIFGIDVYQCVQCHLRCIQKRKDKEIRRSNSLR